MPSIPDDVANSKISEQHFTGAKGQFQRLMPALVMRFERIDPFQPNAGMTSPVHLGRYAIQEVEIGKVIRTEAYRVSVRRIIDAEKRPAITRKGIVEPPEMLGVDEI